MQKMDDFKYNDTYSEPEIIQAEIVEMAPVGGDQWVRSRPAQPRRRWRLHILLFVATCLSTLLVGVSGADAADGWWAGIAHGLLYAVPVMTILVCHEMGHFFQARRYGVRASLPYFIPVPLPPIGTFGAVIAMEPRVGGRRALFDIGVTGPLAGLVPTFVFLVVGLYNSEHASPTGNNWVFGSPLLFQCLAYLVKGPLPEGRSLALDPMAFAGWVGLLVTSLNLIPIGQLDGGHVLYALLRRKAHKVASLLLLAALATVVWKWRTLGHWSLMLFLLFLIGPIHPPTADDDEPLGAWRTVLGWLALAFIIVGFTPVPIYRTPF
ncbi:MAG: site-2 protease family protein [Pirellulales bacterium]|nr:site-2 protease family protein [Pirellulales bacterium]